MKNVVFKTLKIRNFLSFGKEQVFNFSDGISAIFGINHDRNNDENGSGKSSVMCAVNFALYGNTIKELKKDEIVNRIAGKDCFVELTFDIVDGGSVDEYVIQRGIAPSLCKLYKNGSDISLSGIPATSAYIVDLIETTEPMFQNTVMMTSEKLPFMRLRKNDRRTFIEGVFSLSFLNDMKKMVKNESDAVSVEYRANDDKLKMKMRDCSIYEDKAKNFDESKKRIISEYNDKIKNEEDEYNKLCGEGNVNKSDYYTENIKKIDKLISDNLEANSDIKAKVQNIKSTFITLTSRKEKLLNVIASKEKENNLIVEEIRNATAMASSAGGIEKIKYRIIECESEIQKYNDDEKKLGVELATLTVRLNDNEDKLRILTERGNVCPTCGREYDDVEKCENDKREIKDKISELTKKVTAVKKSLVDVKFGKENIDKEKINLTKISDAYREASLKQIYNVDEYKDEVESIDKKFSEFKSELVKLSEENKKYSDELIELKNRRENEVNLKNEAEKHENAMKLHLNTIEMLKNARTEEENKQNGFVELVEDAKKDILEYETNNAEFAKKIEIYSLAKAVLADDAFRAHMIKRYVNVLNSLLEKYLDMLDSPDQIVFDEFFEEVITDTFTGKECSYDSLSSGEKKRVDLACMLALIDILTMQGKVKFSTVFYDEVFDSALSAGACEKLMSVLKTRCDENHENAILITHKFEMKTNELINRFITVEKLGGISEIKEND